MKNLVVLLTFLFISGHVGAQQQVGISDQPEVIADDLLPGTGTKGLHSVAAPTSLIAGVHLVAGNRNDVLDTEAFHFGPVAGQGGQTALCLLIESIDARYRGQWRYEVYGDTTGMSPRALKTDHSESLREAFRVGLIRSLGVLGNNCEEYTVNVLVATGFVQQPDTLEIILAMENGFPDVRLLHEEGSVLDELSCRLIDAPDGFRCTMPIKGIAAGTHQLEVSIDYNDGAEPDVITSQIALGEGGN